MNSKVPHKDSRGRRLISKWLDGKTSLSEDPVSIEEPIELRINGVSIAVIMRSPGSDFELAAGFIVTEGIIDSIDQISVPFDEIIICIATATNDQMRRIVAICKATLKPYRTVPTLTELMDEKVSLSKVRDVSMVDLLGRQEVQLDHSSIKQYIYGKRVLVTGAGGSIGSELVRNCMSFNPDLLILFDQSEHNLFNIERECESEYSIAFQSVLGDIRDKSLVERLFSSFKILRCSFLTVKFKLADIILVHYKLNIFSS